jgi:hypothetical protein
VNADETRPPPSVGVGSPAWLDLLRFGELLFEVFGARAYLVGSAAKGKEFRDVDVRVMLEEDDFVRWFGETGFALAHSPKWNGICVAFSYLGARNTGLNIDFQVQPLTLANGKYGNEVREPLILLERA